MGIVNLDHGFMEPQIPCFDQLCEITVVCDNSLSDVADLDDLDISWWIFLSLYILMKQCCFNNNFLSLWKLLNMKTAFY